MDNLSDSLETVTLFNTNSDINSDTEDTVTEDVVPEENVDNTTNSLLVASNHESGNELKIIYEYLYKFIIPYPSKCNSELCYKSKLINTYKAPEFDIDIREYYEYSEQEILDIVNKLKYIDCRVYRQAMPISATDMVVYESTANGRSQLELPHHITAVYRCGKTTYICGMSDQLKHFERSPEAIINLNDYVKFVNLESLCCMPKDIYQIDKFTKLTVLKINVYSILSNSSCICVHHAPKTLKHLLLYCDLSLKRKDIVIITGLDVLHLVSLCVHDINTDLLRIEYDCSANYLSIDNTYKSKIDGLSITDGLTYLRTVGNSPLFDSIAKNVKTWEVYYNKRYNFSKYTNLTTLIAVTNQEIWVPRNLRLLKIIYDEYVDHTSIQDYTDLRNLQGLHISGRCKIRGLPEDLEWLCIGNNTKIKTIPQNLKLLISIPLLPDETVFNLKGLRAIVSNKQDKYYEDEELIPLSPHYTFHKRGYINSSVRHSFVELHQCLSYSSHHVVYRKHCD